jgi:hypothetical protein
MECVSLVSDVVRCSAVLSESEQLPDDGQVGLEHEGVDYDFNVISN